MLCVILGLPLFAIIVWFDNLSYPVCPECGDNGSIINKSGNGPVCVKHGALKKCA